MESQRTAFGWALRLEIGEEVVTALESFAIERGIRAGSIAGIGAVRDPELGFFVPATRTYVRHTFPGDHEIGSLTGNYSELDGKPFPHCHVVIGGPDFAARTGHLFRAVVSVTCELWIAVEPARILRVRRPDLGFNPLELTD